jgi:hypothetical protein
MGYEDHLVVESQRFAGPPVSQAQLKTLSATTALACSDIAKS